MKSGVLPHVVLGLVLTITSCATSTMLTSWVDPEAVGKTNENANMLLIGVAKNAVLRRQFEDSFARELTGKKIRAMVSYQALPDPQAVNEESVAPVVSQNNITHVLVTRVIDRKTVTTYVPPTTTAYATGYPSYYPSYYGSWYGYYNTGYTTVSSPGYTYETELVNLETNVYDVRSGKLVWTGLTETEMGSQMEAQIQEFIQLLISTMTRDKFL